MQITVQRALTQIREKLMLADKDGYESEILYAVAPKALVVCGSLTEFKRGNSVNESKFRAFELYRRSLHNPEIITFDELYERARFIVAPGP